MSVSDWWNKTRYVVNLAQDEILKVTQIGKAQIDRSFLTHERSRLYEKLGELTYSLIKQGDAQLPDAKRLVDQIDRLTRKIGETREKMKDLIDLLSLSTDAGPESFSPEPEKVEKEPATKKTRHFKKNKI